MNNVNASTARERMPTRRCIRVRRVFTTTITATAKAWRRGQVVAVVDFSVAQGAVLVDNFFDNNHDTNTLFE